MPAHDQPEEASADQMLLAPRADRANDALRQATLQDTLGVIRTRRRMRRLLTASALAACYLAGMFTMQAWKPSRPDSVAPSPSPVAVHTPRVDESPRAVPPKTRPIAIAQKSRYEVLRDSGDSLVSRGDNLQTAVRTYARALSVASPEERAIAPGKDNWLLLALKTQR